MNTGWITLGSSRLETARWGSGTGLPILLIHEGLGSIRLWKDFPEKLAESSGREVIAWSRHGHGWSGPRTGPRARDYMHIEADLLPQVMDALGLRGAHWLGHSDGASIALIAAALHPSRAASLILEAPHVCVEAATNAGIAASAAAFPASDMGQRMERYHADPLPLFADWSSIWLDPDFQSWNIEDLLTRITAPALMIQGRDDEFGTFDQLDRIAAHLAETVRVELDSCRHSPHFDRQDMVISAICTFLEARD